MGPQGAYLLHPRLLRTGYGFGHCGRCRCTPSCRVLAPVHLAPGTFWRRVKAKQCTQGRPRGTQRERGGCGGECVCRETSFLTVFGQARASMGVLRGGEATPRAGRPHSRRLQTRQRQSCRLTTTPAPAPPHGQAAARSLLPPRSGYRRGRAAGH